MGETLTQMLSNVKIEIKGGETDEDISDDAFDDNKQCQTH